MVGTAYASTPSGASDSPKPRWSIAIARYPAAASAAISAPPDVRGVREAVEQQDRAAVLRPLDRDREVDPVDLDALDGHQACASAAQKSANWST